MWYYKYIFLASLIAYALIIRMWAGVIRRRDRHSEGPSSAS